MTIFICTGNDGKLQEFKQALQNFDDVVSLNDLNPLAKKKYIEPLENSDYFVCNALIKLFSAFQFVIQSQAECGKEIKKIIVDDSGLCVPALNYLPGVHSASFAGHPRSDNKNKILLQKKIDENFLAHVYKDEKRLSAFFVCFLLSIQIEGENDFEFIQHLNLSSAVDLLNTHRGVNKDIVYLEKRFLENVNLKIRGGSTTEKVQASLFCKAFPNNIFINFHYGYCCGEVSTKEQNLIPGAGHGYDSLFYPLENPDLSFASIPLSEKNSVSHRAFAMKSLCNTPS